MQFRISTWQAIYLDEHGVERKCFVIRMGPTGEQVLDQETGRELDPAPEYFRLQEME